VAFLSGENPYTDDRIRAELGCRPPASAPEAVRRTAHWFLENETPGR
jgi:nucleoside-diphosphate-sugar epimerase